MFDWKVEEQKLTKTKREIKDKGSICYRYDVENELTIEEKKNAISVFSNGDSDYFIALNKKYMADFANGLIKTDSWGFAKEVSKKAWIRRNDTLYKFWNGRSKDNMYTNDFYFAKFFPYGKNWYFGYEITDTRVEEAFHGLCQYLEKEERKWFCEHDEYEILKTKFLNCGCPSFGVDIHSYSDGSIMIGDGLSHENWKEGKRPITIEELKILLEKYEQLQEYKKELEKSVRITY